MIIIAGWIEIDPADRDTYVAGCIPVVVQARTAPGCLDFAIAVDLVEPNRITIYERWETDAELENFRGSGPDAGQTAQIRNADVRRYRISSVEDA